MNSDNIIFIFLAAVLLYIVYNSYHQNVQQPVVTTSTRKKKRQPPKRKISVKKRIDKDSFDPFDEDYLSSSDSILEQLKEEGINEVELSDEISQMLSDFV